MLKFTDSKKTRCVAFGALLSVCLGLSATAQAQTVLDPAAVVPNTNGSFTYNYSVTDATTMELAIVNVPVAANSALTNLIAPAGFEISFDPGAGFVSFFEDNDPATTNTFASTSTVTGFSYTSIDGPGAVTFDALDVSGTQYTGPTLSAVPEPTSLIFSLGGFALAGGILIRRRTTQSTPIQ